MLGIQERGAPARDVHKVNERSALGLADRTHDAEAEAAQVEVKWGTDPLFIKEVRAGEQFVIGPAHSDADVDFVIPDAIAGRCSWALVEARGGELLVVVPPGACARLVEPGADEPIAIAGVAEVPLRIGSVVELEIGTLCLCVRGIEPHQRMARSLGGGWQTLLGYFGTSALSVAALLSAMAFFVPPLGTNGGEKLDADRLYLIQQYLDAASEREQKEQEQETPAEDEPMGGKEGAQAAGEEGALGKLDAPATKNRLAVRGPPDNPTPELMTRSEAESFGMIGILAGGAAYDGPTSPWARDDALGSDPISAHGNMWGDQIGDTRGFGGLGLFGAGDGGGSKYQGIGLGTIGTIGSLGSCTGPGPCTGIGNFGAGHGRVGGGHRIKSPRVRMAQPTVSGRLPPQTIQRIVRQNFGRMRLCYERALGQNPNLEGRVQVRFLISRDGSVSTASNGSSTLPDSGVVSCVVRAFYGLSFPKPENGTVQVRYPILFSPG
jgi:hypothetical protein